MTEDKRATDLKRALLGAEAAGTDVLMVDLPSGYAILHPGVTTLDEIDSIVAEMVEQEAEANARATDRQRAIGTDVAEGGCGYYWWRLHEDGFGIFGRVTPWDEFVQRERELTDDKDERVWILDRHLDNIGRGYRYGRCYSPVVPDGELGDTHVAEMTPMTEAEFNEAKQRDWDIDRCVEDGLRWAVRLWKPEP